MRRRTPRILSALIAASALALTPLVAPAAVAAPGDPVVVSAVDFEDGTTGSWTQSGGPTLAVVDDPSGDTGKVLSVTGRANGHDTIQSPTALFENGVTYTVSARVLIPGTAGEARFVVKDGFHWVGNTTVPADEWKTVSSTFTADADDSQIYFEVSPASASFFVDDIRITKPEPAPAGPPIPEGHELVAWNDFSDAALGTALRSSGGASLSFADGVLAVNDRNNDFVGIETVPGLLEPGVQYTVSAKIKLAEGTPATQARWVGFPGYNWIGNANVTDADWTTLTGSWLAPTTTGDPAAPVDPATIRFYIGTNNITDVAAYTYYLDDVLITKPKPAECEPTTVTVATTDFAGGALPAELRSSGGASLSFADGALVVNDRGGDFVGIETVPGLLEPGVQYTVSAKVKLAAGTPTTQARWVGFPGYNWVGNADVTADDWTTIAGSWLAPTTTGDPAAPVDPATIRFYIGTSDISGLTAYTYLVDDVLITKQVDDCGGEDPTQEPGTVLIDEDFEDGELGDWFAREGTTGSNPTVGVVAGGAAETGFAAQVSDRSHEGDGLQVDVKDVLLPGKTYELEAYVRFAPGADLGRGLTVSMRTVLGTSQSFANLAQIENATATGWTKVAGQFTVPGYDANAELYVEARYNSGNTSTFLVDQVKVWVPEPDVVDTSLVPIKDTVGFPVGVAIDERETTGAASDLLLHHFDQITPENHMKVEAWYGDDKTFARHSQATALLDFAQENDLRLYGHVLLWHSQTPAWFFQDDTGRELTSSAADKQLLRERLAKHIDDVAKSIADDYGLYGSATNPVAAWDVVNEVVADQATPDGLRTSRWHDVLGEEYIHLAFELADEAFNETYAAPGADRPVKLFINDYNTEQDRKGDQYEALVKRLLDAGVPLDGVGHQFHLSITSSIASLQAALDRFAGLDLLQEVTELDVTINPADEPNRIKQGHFYRDAFNLFRSYDAAAPASEKLFAVTVWGLTDTRSWRASQQPLLFTGGLQAKPAYYGAVDDDEGVPPLINTANVFGGDVPLAAGFEDAVEWRNLPENVLTGEVGGFQSRWNADHLTVLVRTTVAPERLEFTYGDDEFAYGAGVADSVPGITTVVGGVHYTAVHLPHTDAAAGASVDFDVRVVAEGAVAGAWNTAGSTGRLTFLEPLSFQQVPELAAPTVDGTVDAVWSGAAVANTAKRVEGNAAGAQAEVRTLWKGDTLYALFQVTDPEIDTTNSDPWNQDSVELFLDLGNSKTGAYGPNDSQIRITVENKLSFGTGDAAAQQARVLASATTVTPTGYVVEIAIALKGQSGGQNDVPLGGLDTFHGLDFQVNDGRAGARYAVHTWAEPTGTGYQTTARWGVAQLVAGPEEPDPPVGSATPTISGTARVGSTLTAKPGTWESGATLAYQWFAGSTRIDGATAATLVLTPAQLGSTIAVEVTGSKPGRESVTKRSAPTAKVATGTLVKKPVPTISGTAKVGSTLTVKPGTWDSGVKLAYQWYANGTAITGAKATTITLAAAQQGKTVTVKVTGSKPGYTPATTTSKATAKVAAGTLVKKPIPTISGTAKVGKKLTAKAGTWDSGVKLAYQWYAGGTAIKGAKATTITLTSAQQGKTITVKVTGTKAGYTTVTKTSKATAKVAAGTLVKKPIPTISGTAKVGKKLTAKAGTWDSGVKLAYQWYAGGTAIKGAKATTITLTTAQQGKTVTVKVTGSKPGYTTVTKTSKATAKVARR